MTTTDSAEHMSAFAAADKTTLVALYEATRGDEWFSHDGWLSDTPIGDWYGVTTNEEGRVVKLDLSNNNLQGPIPRALSELTALTILDLYRNRLDGPIPTALGDLTELTFLGLSNNRLSGFIPTDIGRLTQLVFLGLNDNDLVGRIPNELGNLTALTFLGLRNNQLGGHIPVELGNLRSLRQLGLNRNNLEGPIPESLGNLESIERLLLWGNDLAGPIPRQIGALSSLTHLGLHDNALVGAIPDALGNISGLIELWLNNNLLYGDIPPALSELSELEYLNLSGNVDLDGYRPEPQSAMGARHGNIFNLDITGFSDDVYTSSFHVTADAPRLPELARPGELDPSAAPDTATGGREREHATFHLFAVAPIELYVDGASAVVQNLFENGSEWKKWEDETFFGQSPRPTTQEGVTGRASSLLTDLDMELLETYYRAESVEIGGQSVRAYAVFFGNPHKLTSASRTGLCLLLHAQHELETGQADAKMYHRIRWALSIADEPPRWLQEVLPFNPQGALYRATWIWIYQRYMQRQWRDGTRAFAREHTRLISKTL